ncbi:putative oxalyl-CoA decarboxylase [Gregarina niphandrodes]|uniref:2-hydroxyacyl-CoA lyase n=1 Tax=Gregarina niphandrodes TaxID=110365 RepID=A0A023BAX3_GRENI|nr:putative oxalyl-CoA decarboxylase [Gregarina niphandrodes]EZG78864.1 putative oxalyl-CoA decarboxylase [Gregarina niphandrodes]|eukprot:XP_011129172.1 putative oxalyl-CoA decarboxylase [Gregarina niphandrodes]
MIGELLSELGVHAVFAVPGIPITDALNDIQGVTPPGAAFPESQEMSKGARPRVVVMRHEANAVNAAAAYGYISGRHGVPGLVMTTSGPAVLNALSQVITPSANQFPVVLFSSGQQKQNSTAIDDWTCPLRFQEMNQINIARKYVELGLLKAAFEVTECNQMQEILQQAFSCALSGKKGPVYVQVDWHVWTDIAAGRTLRKERPVPDDKIFEDKVSEDKASEGRYECTEGTVEACQVVKHIWQKRTLFVFGENFIYCSRDEDLPLENFPFVCLTTPSARGTVSGSDVYACRSRALKECEVAVFVGCEFDWRFKPTDENLWAGKHVYVVNGAPASDRSTVPGPCEVTYVVDKIPNNFVTDVVDRVSGLNQASKSESRSSVNEEWLQELLEQQSGRLNAVKKAGSVEKGSAEKDSVVESIGTRVFDGVTFAGLYGAISTHHQSVASPWYFVAEGASCMDAARRLIRLPHSHGRYLDAGVNGAMGIGFPYAIGLAVADLVHKKDPKVRTRVALCIGDSAFGFSGMEMETVRRYCLPICICVLDNSGMYAIAPYRLPLERPPLERPPRPVFNFLPVFSPLPVIDATDLSPVDFCGFWPDQKAGNSAWERRTRLSSQCQKLRVENKVDLKTHLPELLNKFETDGTPSIVHVMIDPKDGSGQGFVANQNYH